MSQRRAVRNCTWCHEADGEYHGICVIVKMQGVTLSLDNAR